MRVGTIETRFAAVGVSLAILLAALFVVLQAGEDQSLGPLDLETADSLALAMWVVAPVVGGLVARRLSNREMVRTALVFGLVVGLAAAALTLVASGTGDYACSLNLPSVPGGYPLGCLAVGALAGLGMGVGFLVGGAGARRPVTVLPGVVFAAVATWVATAAAYLLFYGAVRCLR
jgi:hypothetical protein